MRLITLFSLVILMSACNEDDQIIGAGDCVEVTLIDQLCGQAVFKIEDPAFYHLGESANDEANVFYALLTCQDTELPTDESFLVELLDEYEPGSCAVCQALLEYDGDKRYNVRKVDACVEE